MQIGANRRLTAVKLSSAGDEGRLSAAQARNGSRVRPDTRKELWQR